MSDKTGKGEGGWKTVEGLPALNGEDVAVFIGTCTDRLVAGVLVAPKE